MDGLRSDQTYLNGSIYNGLCPRERLKMFDKLGWFGLR